MKQKSRLGLRSLLAAAALLTAATPAARAAELNYTVDNLGVGRYVVDFYTSTDIGFGAGSWTYGARPMRRAVEKYIEDPMAEEVLKGNIKPSDSVTVQKDGDKLGFVITHKPQVEVQETAAS